MNKQLRSAEDYRSKSFNKYYNTKKADLNDCINEGINKARIDAIKEAASVAGVENQPIYQSILSLINQLK